MKYVIYKLYFLNGVHFGNNSLESSLYTLCADTLFSALCQEAVKMGPDTLATFYQYTHEKKLIFSDTFPFRNNELYLPKPFIYIDHGDKAGDSTVKKAFKKMKYISCDHFSQYLKGQMRLEQTYDLNDFGHSYQKTSVSVRGELDPVPYRVGIYYYNDGNGIYFIAGVGDSAAEALLDELMDSLSASGLGGKRSSGLGRFDYYCVECPEELSHRLTGEWKSYMSLSVSLAQEGEMEEALCGASYSLVKRSGFVASELYSEEQMRKKDLYVFSAGSCFQRKFSGDIYDVSNHGKHPVFRYAIPMFLGVDI